MKRSYLCAVVIALLSGIGNVCFASEGRRFKKINFNVVYFFNDDERDIKKFFSETLEFCFSKEHSFVQNEERVIDSICTFEKITTDDYVFDLFYQGTNIKVTIYRKIFTCRKLNFGITK